MEREHYSQDMSVEEIEKVAAANHAQLWDVLIYLNEEGKAAMEAHHIIGWCCPFSKSKLELAETIDWYCKERNITDAKVLKNLKHFRKNYLIEQEGC